MKGMLSYRFIVLQRHCRERFMDYPLRQLRDRDIELKTLVKPRCHKMNMWFQISLMF
jgi:hypothetical protein